MLTTTPQPARPTHAPLRPARRGLLLLLTLLLCAATLAAQTTQEAKEEEAADLLTEGLQLLKQGTKESLQTALRKYTEAMTILDAAGNARAGAVVRGGIAQIHDSLGEKQEALKYFGQALEIRRSLGDKHGMVETLNSLGNVHKDLGERDETLSLYKQALDIAVESGDRGGAATTLNNAGKACHDWGESQKALSYYEQALSLFRQVKNDGGAAITLNNIATVYSDRGDVQQAFDSYSKALALARTAGDVRQQAVVLNNIGTVYVALGDRENALRYFNDALPLRRQVGDMDGAALTLNNVGAVLNRLDKPEDALERFNKALTIKRETGDRVGEAMLLSNMGVVYDDWGKYDEALDHFSKALNLRRVVQDTRGTLATLNNIGTTLGRLPNDAEALKYFQLALKLGRFLGDRQAEADILLNVAYIEARRGDLASALANSDQALGIIESLRTKTASQELRASYLATEHSKYEFYIDLLMRLHKAQPAAGYDAKALQASERARARSLLELLTEARVDIRRGVDAALVGRERDLLGRLNAKAQEQQQFVPGQQNAQRGATLGKEIEAILTDLQQLDAQIRQSSPRYASLSQPRPLTLTEMQAQVLDADTMLLEYSLGAQRSYLWAVTKNSINSYELPAQTQLETAARQFHDLLASPAIGGQADADREKLTETAAHLSRMLLGPVAAQLGAKRLLIVADGALQYVPFAALPDPSVAGQGAEGQRPLITRYEVVNLPSLSVLPALREELTKRQPARHTIAVLADPVFSADDVRVKKAPARRSKDPQARPAGTALNEAEALEAASAEARRPERLLGTRKEAQGVLALAPPGGARMALDFDASRDLTLSGELGQYRHVLFATHGWIDEGRPALSSIVLSLVNNKGDAQNGYLRLNEIYNLNLHADLVALSGCQTGLGQELAGEGLVGFMRGFMYAGAPRVVTSLWRVDDDATAELMVNFYRGMLREGKRPAEALRAAQLSMLRKGQWQSPRYWAAFVLQGEWR